jgi:hypothetical protein
MIVRFKTESGSCYIVDTIAKTWQRDGEVPIRTGSGVYYEWSGAKLGESVWFTGEGIVMGTRLISTSPVTEIG